MAPLIPDFRELRANFEPNGKNSALRRRFPQAEGKVYTVRYEAVNAMLPNDFLKGASQTRGTRVKGAAAEATITQLKSTAAMHETTIAKRQKEFQSTIAQQQRQIEALRTGLQKVSAQVELNKAAPQAVADNQ
jgi:Rps23 Pro-64 3,4-dihydroxylase Tpa1-like proline 4-hydroxylase